MIKDIKANVYAMNENSKIKCRRLYLSKQLQEFILFHSDAKQLRLKHSQEKLTFIHFD